VCVFVRESVCVRKRGVVKVRIHICLCTSHTHSHTNKKNSESKLKRRANMFADLQVRKGSVVRPGVV
jgi:hypothetical protein